MESFLNEVAGTEFVPNPPLVHGAVPAFALNGGEVVGEMSGEATDEREGEAELLTTKDGRES